MPRKLMRGVGRPPRKVGNVVLVCFRVTTEERDAYQRLADSEELTLSGWIRARCEAARRGKR